MIRPIRKVSLALCLGVLLAGGRLGAADVETPAREPLSDRNLLDAGKLILFDTGEILTAPIRWDGNDWLKFGLTAGVVTGTVLALDQPIREASQRSRTTSRDDVATTIQRFGAEYSFGVIGAFAVAGWGFDDSKSRRVAVDALAASLIAGGIVTTSVKYLVGRYRPSETEATWYAQPFSNRASFVSGHATQAFAVAAVIAGHYRQPWVRVTSFFIAGCVGLARIHLNQHYASDVVAGAILGTAIGGSVVTLNERRRAAPEASRLTVTPLVVPGGGGLRLSAVF